MKKREKVEGLSHKQLIGLLVYIIFILNGINLINHYFIKLLFDIDFAFRISFLVEISFIVFAWYILNEDDIKSIFQKERDSKVNNIVGILFVLLVILIGIFEALILFFQAYLSKNMLISVTIISVGLIIYISYKSYEYIANSNQRGGRFA